MRLSCGLTLRPTYYLDVVPNAMSVAQVVTVGTLLAQSLGLAVLSWLFLTRNEYYKMSSLAHTGMLPTNNFRND